MFHSPTMRDGTISDFASASLRLSCRSISAVVGVIFVEMADCETIGIGLQTPEFRSCSL
jgi:hypothetical protein